MIIEVVNDHGHLRFSKKETIRVVKRVLRSESKNVRQVSVVFTSNRRIRKINATFLNHDYVTDVIAFRLEPRPAIECEIYINLDRARIQALEFRATVLNEIRRLVAHGLLHILGHNDVNPRAKMRMTLAEDAVIRSLK